MDSKSLKLDIYWGSETVQKIKTFLKIFSIIKISEFKMFAKNIIFYRSQFSF